MSKSTGGAAFPFIANDKTSWRDSSEGMTLRDYFAAQAMSAMMQGNQGYKSDSFIAEAAYRAADAMLEARK